MSISEAFLRHFSSLNDPRIENHNKRHSLSSILVITLLGVICGADNWVDIETFGKCKEDWLSTFLDLPNGIPSHDTFGRLFAALDHERFQECFINWVNSSVVHSKGDLIAIDGKSLRGSRDEPTSRRAIHMVNAWCTQNQLVLGQFKTQEKSNEITAIPELLEMLDLKGSVISIDAMGCQRHIAEKIIAGDSDYILAVKSNQEKLYELIRTCFNEAKHKKFEGIGYRYYETLDKGHGRIEQRCCYVLSGVYVQPFKSKWKDLQSIVLIESEAQRNGEKIKERRYYITSLTHDAKKIAGYIRDHWKIENQCHWVLDVAFSEDLCRTRTQNSAANLSIIRHIALNLLTQDKSIKVGKKTKRKLAGWDNSYLAGLLQYLKN